MSEFDLYINPSASPGILRDQVLRFPGGRSSMELQHATIRVIPSGSSEVGGAASACPSMPCLRRYRSSQGLDRDVQRSVPDP